MPRFSQFPYLKKHYNTWCFRYRLPNDVRHAFNGKHEYIKSLGTSDLGEAERRKQFHLSCIINEIKSIRENDESPILDAVLYWRKTLDETAGNNGATDHYFEKALDKAVKSHIPGGWDTVRANGGTDPDMWKAIEKSPQGQKVSDFMNIATGRKTPSNAYIGEWYESYDVKPQTKDLARSEVIRFTNTFPLLDEITKKSVTRWVEKRRKDGTASTTIMRALTHMKSYWKYLQRIEKVPDGYNPFTEHGLKKKNGGGKKVHAFKLEDIRRILQQVEKKKKDEALKFLILIDLYTGMRIEEACSLKVANITADMFQIINAKTRAGERDLPIHSDLKGLIHYLKKNSKDGYLIPNLDAGKYGERSKAIGKRFGYLKNGLGFESRVYCFNSLRHTFSTQLLQVGVRSLEIEILMGHKTKILAIDIYSEGTSEEQKRTAIEKLEYPSWVTDYLKTYPLHT